MPSVMDLLLYVLQQLGVMFAVGAETIVLVAYLLAIRDQVIDNQEERFAHAVKKVLFLGIILILISGAAITALELFAGNQTVVFAPAYIFKCCLIGLVVFLSLVIQGNSLPEGLLEGFAGGTWYALFIIHILAPVAGWNQLVILYLLWIIGFMACWSALVYMIRGKSPAYADVSKKSQPQANQAPRTVPHATAASFGVQYAPTPPAAAVRKPIASPPAPNPSFRSGANSPAAPLPTRVQTQPRTAPPTQPQAPYQPPASVQMPPPQQTAHPLPLPTIRVMPKSPEDVQKQNRGGMVGLNPHPL